MRSIKHTRAAPADFVHISVDQTFHLIALFVIALAV
jgi:hypothetical protein